MPSERVRLAVAIIDRYPRVWRDRYGDELRAMLDETGASWGDVVDLARGALAEWRVELLDPERHAVALKLALLAGWLVPRAMVAATLFLLARILPPRLHAIFGPPAWWIYLAAGSALLFAMIRWFRHYRRFVRVVFGNESTASQSRRARRRRVGVSFLVCAFAIVAVAWADGDPITWRDSALVIYGAIYVCAGSRDPRLVRAVARADSLRERLKWSCLELNRLLSISRTPDDERALDRQRTEVAELAARLADAHAEARQAIAIRGR